MGILFAFLLIAHMLGDFTLQPSGLAEAKKKNTSWLLLHVGIYAACILITLLLCVKVNAVLLPFLVLTFSHLVIDIIRARVIKLGPEEHRKELGLFFMDQIFHIVTIVTVLFLFSLPMQIGGILGDLVEKYSYKQVKVIALIAMVYLFVLNPCAVAVKKVLNSVMNGKDLYINGKDCEGGGTKENGIDKCGYFIGIFERLITVTLVLLGQFGALGFVITAKSLARFKQLEVQGFAEKYLVGTLLSVTLALLFTLFIKIFF